jgi:hypothetical protein
MTRGTDLRQPFGNPRGAGTAARPPTAPFRIDRVGKRQPIVVRHVSDLQLQVFALLTDSS